MNQDEHRWHVFFVGKTTKPWEKHAEASCLECGAKVQHYYDIVPSFQETARLSGVPTQCLKTYNPVYYESPEIYQKRKTLMDNWGENGKDFWCPYEHFPFVRDCKCGYCKETKEEIGIKD